MQFGRSLLFFLATLVMYLGWPLVGWGLGGLAGFFLSLPRLGFAVVVALFSLAVGVQAFHGVEGIRGKSGEKEKLVRDEEATIHREFGEEWGAYCTSSWRLIPFLY